ncbi:MAG: RNA polymerase sigma factor [bacterium]|nr:RNA polymerase sigma factor [bacterium]
MQNTVDLVIEEQLTWMRKVAAVHLRRSFTSPEVDDLVQDCLLKALRGFDANTFESVGALRSWLATILINKVREDRRRGQAQKRDAGDVAVLSDVDDDRVRALRSREPDPCDVARAREFEQRLRSVWGHLSERDRRVIELRKVRGLGFEEIARRMGLGASSSARALLTRGLARLAARVSSVPCGDSFGRGRCSASRSTCSRVHRCPAGASSPRRRPR